MRRARHWTFGTTADIGIAASAPTPEALFGEMGRALFSLMTKSSSIRPDSTKEILVSSSSMEGLLVDFLSELLYLHDTGGWLFRRFRVELAQAPEITLRAWAEGEVWDKERHVSRTEVKAITLHKLELDLRNGRARVIVDI